MKTFLMLAIYFATTGSVFAQIFENNFNALAYDATRLEVERAIIYDPEPTDWQFSHHPSIAFFKGKFYAVFSNGKVGEDEGEQRVQLSESSNFTTWSVPVPLVSTTSTYVLTPGGIFVANENLMVVYYTRNDNAPDLSRPNANLFAKYTSDGINWSAEVDLGIPIFPSHRPSKLSNGKLILTGNRDFYYTNDLTGLSGWIKSGRSDFNSGESATLVEGAIIENADSIYTIFRDVAGRKILWQESSKDGVNWSIPKKTNFTDNNTKSHLGKLPNGKFYYVGTPDTTSMGARTPLVLSVSDDGFNYNRNYVIAADYYTKKYTEGRYKTGQFGYPYSIIHDGYLYVVASRMKEKLEIIRVNLTTLDNVVPMPKKNLSGSAQLDGTALPLNDGWIAGTITNPNSGKITSQGELHIKCAAGESYSFQTTPSTSVVFNPAGDFTVEFNLKVISNNGRGIDIYLRDGLTAASLVCVTTNKVFLNQTPSKLLYELDGTSYHTYRLVVKRDENVMYLFIDGTYVTSLIRSPSSGNVQLLFGKSNAIAATEAYLDYLAYDLSGAYKPVQTTLPVNLKEYKAKLTNGLVQLSWETLDELNNEKFVVEKSHDGVNFDKLASIKPAPDNRYQVTDFYPYGGSNYYKLTQYDKDGKSSTLGLEFLKYDSKDINKVKISPNPVRTGEALYINSPYQDTQSYVSLYTVTGKLLDRKKMPVSLKMPDSPGIYIIGFENHKQITKRKIIVQ
ncbi:exo-alpha-sialidase [Desertivirga xinjiangensis]|uniref:exo-alpha-sialidase n=1 Tax=Desertivirga xinjiangensis TaxID=539206 RepID=UPI00210E0B20|nr:exo-alpha-sialidase [Pedobacter xinjiangensis]